MADNLPEMEKPEAAAGSEAGPGAPRASDPDPAPGQIPQTPGQAADQESAQRQGWDQPQEPTPIPWWEASDAAGAPGAAPFTPTTPTWTAGADLPINAGTTQNWAVSAIVLGSLSILWFGFSTIYAALTPKSSVHLPLMLASLVIAGVFVAGGVGITRHQDHGRQTLTAAAGAALVLTLVSLADAIGVMNKGVPAEKLRQLALTHPEMSRQVLENTLRPGIIAAGAISILIVLIQIGYLVPLILHLRLKRPGAGVLPEFLDLRFAEMNRETNAETSTETGAPTRPV